MKHPAIATLSHVQAFPENYAELRLTVSKYKDTNKLKIVRAKLTLTQAAQLMMGSAVQVEMEEIE